MFSFYDNSNKQVNTKYNIPVFIFFSLKGTATLFISFLYKKNFPNFQPILMKLVSKSMSYKALSHKIYFILGLWSPLNRSGQFRHSRFRDSANLEVANLMCMSQSTSKEEAL